MEFLSDRPTQQAIVATLVEHGQPVRIITLLTEMGLAPKSGVELLAPELPGARRLRSTPERFGAIYQVVDGRIRVWATGPDDAAVLAQARAAVRAARAHEPGIRVAVAAELAADAHRDPDLWTAIADAVVAARRAAADELVEDGDDDWAKDVFIVPFSMRGYEVLVLIAAAVWDEDDWLLLHDDAWIDPAHLSEGSDEVRARKARIHRQLALVAWLVDGLDLL